LEASNVAVTFHDCFESITSWNSWGSGMWALLEDTHHYEVFDQGSVSMDTASHVSTACAFGTSMTQVNKWIISGEWTGAMTDCATNLNGYGKGARYDGSLAGSTYVGSCGGLSSGSVSQLPASTKQSMRMFVEAQLDAFEQAAGWMFWTWHTEGAPGWDLQDMIANGVFPQPVTARQCE
jgi:glucan 1,3-beta-glucosidase